MPPPRVGRRKAMPMAARLIAGLAGLVLCGTLLLMLPASAAKEPLHFNQACFTAISALATTGLSIITPGADLSRFGQIVLLLLMQVGGIGFMVGSVLVFRLIGRRVTLPERLALRDTLGGISAGSAIQLAQYVVLGVLGLEAIGAVLLWLSWAPQLGPGLAAYMAIWHSVSALTNSSFDLFSGAPDAPAGFPLDAFTLLVISGLVIAGSIGIPVISDLLTWWRARRHRLSLHTRLTLITAGLLLFFGTLALFIGFSLPGTLFHDQPWPRRLLMSFFHSASARTSGFVLVPLAEASEGNILVLTMLMFIGGSPASMGGGITTSTLAVLFLTLLSSIRGRTAVEAGTRTLPRETVTKAVAIVAASAAFVLTITWLLLLTQQATLQEALFETTSAFATCGFTLGLTPRLDGFGQFLIGCAMFAGRLGVLTLVVGLARETAPDPLSYPEEKILIG
jgi:trk system potassium uptake protein TrkH